jgi:riboflavin synthase
MFTGIIEELGRVRSLEALGENARIVIEARTVIRDTHHGDSISVNGVCLTALDVREDSFAADVSRETLDRSTLGRLKRGAPVNLERAVTPATRLGGHIVQGHVDARGTFLSADDLGGSWTVRIAYPPEIARYLVFKGSVAVEGISLTIADLTDNYFEIAVIPKTWELTNFSQLQPGDDVNLEADVIAKYVERTLTVGSVSEERPKPTISPWSVQKTFLHLGLLLGVVCLNWLVFKTLLHQNYFLWYLKNGVLISLATPFLALTWKDMKVRIGLISSHPSAYVSAWLQVLGVFIYSLAPLDSTRKSKPKDVGFDIGLYSGFAEVLDSILYYVMAILMLLLGLAWGLLVAPLLYFVTLLAGVPARQQLRGNITPTSVHEETSDKKPEDRGKVTILEPGAGTSSTAGGTFVSFARDPFTVTQAMSAVVLWLANIIYARIG